MSAEMDARDAYEDQFVIVHAVTSKALLLSPDEEAEPAWVPRSLCDDRADELEEGDEAEIGILVWKLEDLGWL